MSQEYKYTTLLVKGPQNRVFAHFPYQSAKIFGTRKPVRVKASFDGKMYRMSLLPRGNGAHWLHVRKEIRKSIGKEEGDMVAVCVEKDDSSAIVSLPDYLEWLLENDNEMMKVFKQLSFSNQKYWVEHIREPISDDARVHRINRLFKFLQKTNSGNHSF